MISEWLELDAVDDWVRHDAEIVSLSSPLPLVFGASCQIISMVKV